jgi:hypothetical protein
VAAFTQVNSYPVTKTSNGRVATITTYHLNGSRFYVASIQYVTTAGASLDIYCARPHFLEQPAYNAAYKSLQNDPRFN